MGNRGYRTASDFLKKIPEIVKDWLKGVVENFLSSYHLKPSQVAHYILHPGGAKVLDAFQQTLGLRENQIRYPRKVLRDYGNLSSCSVLFVLKELLDGKTLRSGDYGLISALGPGFSAELMLLQWT